MSAAYPGAMRSAKVALKRLLFPLILFTRQRYRCVICGYFGPFAHKRTAKPLRSRLNAKCPSCGAMERHRFQWQILGDILKPGAWSEQSLLHFAPEPCLEERLRQRFRTYVSADLFRSNVDQQADVRDLPFADNSFDVILCSMVLHYVEGYEGGLQEIYRVLKPGGLAMMPVPMIHEKTNDEPAKDSTLKMVVEPGPDFYDRYKKIFDTVTICTSLDFSDELHFFLEQTDDHAFPMTLSHQKQADIIPVVFKAKPEGNL